MTFVRQCDGCERLLVEGEESRWGRAEIRDEEWDFCPNCMPRVEEFRKRAEDYYDEMMGVIDARERELWGEFWGIVHASEGEGRKE
jgi:hypothetical protein